MTDPIPLLAGSQHLYTYLLPHEYAQLMDLPFRICMRVCLIEANEVLKDSYW